MERLKNFLENVFFGDRLKFFSEDLFFWIALALVSLILGLGLEHSCPWLREGLSVALASDFFCVAAGLGLEHCVLDSTSDSHVVKSNKSQKNTKHKHLNHQKEEEEAVR